MGEVIKISDVIELIKDVDFNEVTPYDKNYLNHEKNREHIKNSIKDFKYDSPIVVDKNNVIVKGHGRYEALKLLKFDKIPFIHRNIFLDTKTKSAASRVADNESAKAAEVNFDFLFEEVESIGEDFLLKDYGFSFDEEDKETLASGNDITEECEGMCSIKIYCKKDDKESVLNLIDKTLSETSLEFKIEDND